MQRLYTRARDLFSNAHVADIHRGHDYAVVRHVGTGTTVLAGDIAWLLDTIRERGLDVRNLRDLIAHRTRDAA